MDVIGCLMIFQPFQNKGNAVLGLVVQNLGHLVTRVKFQCSNCKTENEQWLFVLEYCTVTAIAEQPSEDADDVARSETP